MSRTLAPLLAPFALLVLLSAAAVEARAQAGTRAELPHASAAVRLATLAERIAKLHAQIGQGILVERSRRALPEAMRDFDTTLRAISARVPSGEIRDNYLLLAILWQEYKAWALKPPTRENARKLGERAEEVVWIAMKGARMLQASARSANEALALKAAQAATLAQRVPRLHLWRRWGIRDETLLNELRLSEAQLRSTLESLRSAPAPSPEIAAELQLAENQAAFLSQASRQLEVGKDTARHLEFVAKTGDHIFESMERIARSYEALE